MTHTHLRGEPLVNWFTKQFKILVFKPACGGSLTGDRFYDQLTEQPAQVTCGICQRIGGRHG